MSKPRLIGYVRVSTEEQETALQLAAMHGAQCDLIFEEKKSSVGVARHALDAALKECRDGDTLVVWKVDRLGRSMLDTASIVDSLKKRGVHFKSLTQNFDTSDPMGQLMLQMLMAFAEFERNMIIERTAAGVAAANAKGHFGGKRRKLTGDKLARAKELFVNRPISPATGKRMTNHEVANLFGVAAPTLLRWVLHEGVPTWGPEREKLLRREPDLDAWRERTNDPKWGRNLNKKAS